MTTCSATGLPNGLTLDAATGLISGTVASGDAVNGPYTVDVAAGDGTYSTDQVFTWTTTGPDETTPTVTAPAAQADAAGDAVSLALSASNADGAPLTYSASGLPDGLNIDPDLGVISGSVADDAIQNAPYAVTVTAADGNGLSSSQTFDWFVRDAAIHVQADSVAVQDGAADSPLAVAAFTDPDFGRQATDFTATIVWGDGQTSQGEVDGADGAFTVTDDHDYAQTGTYPLSVTVSDPAGQSVSASASASVTPATLTASGGFTDGTIPFSSAPLVVATFTDADGDAPASAYAVQINWGDNSPAVSYSGGAGVVDGADGVFRVQAPHSYASDGTYTVTTTITAPDGATATASSTVQQGDVYSGKLAQLTSPWFTDPNPSTHVGDFAAWIDWGDGSWSYGFVQGGNANANGNPLGGGGGVQVGGGGAFQVVGYHDYATPGPYAVSVTVQGPGGQITANTSVQAAPAAIQGYDNTIAAAVNQMVTTPLAILAGPMPGGPEQPAYAVVSAGDGSSPVTVGLQEIGTTYEVLWQHVYQTAGEYAVQALLYNVGGALVGATVSTVALPDPRLMTGISAGLPATPDPRKDPKPNAPLPYVVPSDDAHIEFDDSAHVFAVPKDAGTLVLSVNPPAGTKKEVLDKVLWDVKRNPEDKVTRDATDTPDEKLLPKVGAVGDLLTNKMSTNTEGSFSVWAYVDANQNGKYDPGVDPLLGVLHIAIVRTKVEEDSEVTDHNRLRAYPGGTVNLDGTKTAGMNLDVIPFDANGKPLPKDQPKQMDDAALAKGIAGFKADVTLEGGGDDRMLGVDDIVLGWIQDVTSSSITIHYPNGSAVRTPDVPGPWLDTVRDTDYQGDTVPVVIGTGGSSAFARSSTDRSEKEKFQIKPGKDGGQERFVMYRDAPGVTFPAANASGGWTSTEGGMAFATYLSAYSLSFPMSYAVSGKVLWDVQYVGTNAQNERLKVAFPGGEKIDVSGFPMPAGDAGLQPYAPNYQKSTGGLRNWKSA